MPNDTSRTPFSREQGVHYHRTNLWDRPSYGPRRCQARHGSARGPRPRKARYVAARDPAERRKLYLSRVRLVRSLKRSACGSRDRTPESSRGRSRQQCRHHGDAPNQEFSRLGNVVRDESSRALRVDRSAYATPPRWCQRRLCRVRSRRPRTQAGRVCRVPRCSLYFRRSQCARPMGAGWFHEAGV